ncbi:MAG: hypothetical protein LBU65_09655 [Planctomycetaceae bacterium]|jgi:hypothetical protein|nr:hypothetical protein [Planctomycetaceae bacterium]
MRYARRWASDVAAILAVITLVVTQTISSVSVAGETVEPVENEYAAMCDTVISIAQKLEGKERADVLIALAQLQIVTAHSIDDIKAAMRNIESQSERITALRRLAFLSIGIGESDFTAEIVGLLTEEDKTQSTFAGSLALFMLQHSETAKAPLADSSVLLLNKTENLFESEKQKFELIVRLIEAGEFQVSVRLLSSLADAELQDAARYKLLPRYVVSRLTPTVPYGNPPKEIVDFVEKNLLLFGTQTKRAWGMFAVLGMFNYTDNQIWFSRTYQCANDIEDDEYRSVLLRKLANHFFVFPGRNAVMSFVTFLEDAENSARKVEPLSRRLELLTFIAGIYGKSNAAKLPLVPAVSAKQCRAKFEALICEVKENIKLSQPETLSNIQKIVLLQEIAQAKRKETKIGYVLGEHLEAVKLAANEPNGAELITEILLRIINLYKQNDSDSVKNADEDRLRLPFEQYEREYFTPFKIPEDCGC